MGCLRDDIAPRTPGTPVPRVAAARHYRTRSVAGLTVRAVPCRRVSGYRVARADTARDALNPPASRTDATHRQPSSCSAFCRTAAPGRRGQSNGGPESRGAAAWTRMIVTRFDGRHCCSLTDGGPCSRPGHCAEPWRRPLPDNLQEAMTVTFGRNSSPTHPAAQGVQPGDISLRRSALSHPMSYCLRWSLSWWPADWRICVWRPERHRPGCSARWSKCTSPGSLNRPVQCGCRRSSSG